MSALKLYVPNSSLSHGANNSSDLLRLFFLSIKLAFDAFSQYFQYSRWTRVYLVFDATPQKKKVARCEIRASWGPFLTKSKTLKPISKQFMKLVSNIETSGALSCLNQMSRLILPYASRIDGKILSSNISQYLIPVSVSS